jgi:predicted PolB exonuclease-like 3'-5' exonuclease
MENTKMGTRTNEVAYFVFDVETVVDGKLVANVKYPGDGFAAEEAVCRYMEERVAETGSEFIPYTFHVPVAIVVAKVSSDFRLIDLVDIDEPQYRPDVMTELFWRGWEAYQHPTFVTFNGRCFDMPVLELAAFRYGISLPKWFADGNKSYDQPRNRYNTRSHMDLMDLLTNYGASRFVGGLSLAAQILGKPGKMDIDGASVQRLYDDNRHRDIHDYCRCDVLDTYFVFLRSRVLLGYLENEAERELVDATCRWFANRAKSSTILGQYLQSCRDIIPPLSTERAISPSVQPTIS